MLQFRYDTDTDIIRIEPLQHLLPMATIFGALLVAVAVGLAQLDHLEQIQQEGHLKQVHTVDHLDFAVESPSSMTLWKDGLVLIQKEILTLVFQQDSTTLLPDLVILNRSRKGIKKRKTTHLAISKKKKKLTPSLGSATNSLRKL